MRRLAITLLLAACAKAPLPPMAPPPDASMTALAQLMKNEINPSFSKVTFLVFHGDEIQEDPTTVRAEIQRAASTLRFSIQQLRDWPDLPTQTTEGRDVFYTFAASVDRQAQHLFDAVQHRDNATAATQVQDMADTCNNCHHFFRLKIEDSVVPGRAAVVP